MVSRGIDFRLHWQKQNQTHMFGGRHAEPAIDGGDSDDDEALNNNKKSYLSQSFHGSKRHLRGLARNGLTIVSEYGRSTVFITLTCNHLWPEIQEALLHGQTAFDRPDVVCRVFKHRLAAFLYNLRVGKYFDDFDAAGFISVRRRIIYEMSCREYQHRGLPHAHIIVKLENAPEMDDSDACSRFIDAHISCCMPCIDDYSSDEDKKYKNLVESHLVHHCSRGVNGCLNDSNICSKGYHATTLRSSTTFDDKGFAQYKRTRPDDLRVVPHNRKMVLDWEGHAYVDWSASTYAVLYLYKVIYTVHLLTLTS